MLKHYLRGTIRQFARQKGYTIITVLGLAIGLACFIVTASWLRFETSYDSHLENSERIARIIGRQEFAAGDYLLAPLPWNLAPALAQEFTEFEQTVRVQSPQSVLFSVGDTRYYESRAFYADSNFFSIFSFPFRYGDPATALRGPDKAVLTPAIAEKYFGRDNPIGQTIRLDNRVDLTVTGVLEPIPENTSIRPDILVTMSTHEATIAGTFYVDWRTNAYGTFVLLAPGVDRVALGEKLFGLLDKYRPDGTPPKLLLQPMREIHLTAGLQGDFDLRRSKTLLWMFAATALLVLTIACVNYTNLATAQAANRDREIGVRKVLGADRPSLLRQFLGESLITTGVAMVLALALSELIVIGGERWFSAQMDRYFHFDGFTASVVLGIWLLVGFGAGAYPALFLSSLRPVAAMRRQAGVFARTSLLRGALVVVQFVISIALIIGTITVYRQLTYFTSRDLGFNREQIVTVPLAGQELKDKVPELKTALAAHPAVQSVTAMGALPSAVQQSSASFNWEGGPPDEQLLFNLNVADEQYLATFDIPLIDGRNFRAGEEPVTVSADSSEAVMPCIINETAARKMGWSDPVGRDIVQPPDLKIRVVGLVKDYNYATLHVPIRPLMLYLEPTRALNLAIKISTTDYERTLEELQQAWSRVVPERPFNYSFLDESFARSYAAEKQAGRILLMYTVLAIVIACLGLISLASYRIAKRTKETGVRKVLGASVGSLVFLHTREFVIWVAVANLIAWPLGWYAMDTWLQNFAYRVEVTWWTYLVAGLAALLFSLLTVAVQTVKAASANPVQSLRYE